jgi:CO dehydrogenase/acetyl-CoA synthase alpha subunit
VTGGPDQGVVVCPFSKSWKHGKCIRVVNATRAISDDRRVDRGRGKVADTVMRRARMTCTAGGMPVVMGDQVPAVIVLSRVYPRRTT